MALVSRAKGAAGVFMWCQNCHIGSSVLEDPDGMMRVPKGTATQGGMLVALEKVAMSALVVQCRSDHLEFRYVF